MLRSFGVTCVSYPGQSHPLATLTAARHKDISHANYLPIITPLCHNFIGKTLQRADINERSVLRIDLIRGLEISLLTMAVSSQLSHHPILGGMLGHSELMRSGYSSSMVNMVAAKWRHNRGWWFCEKWNP